MLFDKFISFVRLKPFLCKSDVSVVIVNKAEGINIVCDMVHSIFSEQTFKLRFKGTVSVISSDPLFKEENVRFTMVPLKPLTLHRVERSFYLNISKPA